MTRLMKNQNAPCKRFTDRDLQLAIGLNSDQWRSLKVAAYDAAMEVRPYIRIMLLCAAGHGGVVEHAERAVAASWEAESK